MKKGFTLAELLIVIFLLAVVALMVIGGLFNSSDALDFVRAENALAGKIRTVRSYALAGREMPDVGCGVESKRFGVHLREDLYLGFGEVCEEGRFSYDGFGELVGDSVFLEDNGYSLSVLDDGGNELELPVSIFYEVSDGDFTVVQGDSGGDGEAVPISESRYIIIGLRNTDDKVREIVILQAAGLPESRLYLDF